MWEKDQVKVMKSSTLYLKEEKSSFDQPSIKLQHKILL